MSTRASDVSQEEHQGRNHRTRLTAVASSEALGKLATCGDSQVKLMDMNEFSEVFAIIELEEDRGMSHIENRLSFVFLTSCVFMPAYFRIFYTLLLSSFAFREPDSVSLFNL